MPDTTNPIGFTDANELREKNRATVEKYMNTKGQDRLRRHELFVEDGCGTVALRVPTGSPDAVRLEHRVAGADANPYLLLAAVLAGVHHGLTNKVEPGAPIEGNSYEQMEPSLPNNLRDALRELDESEIMAKYIDPKYIDIFVACKESELEEFAMPRNRLRQWPARRSTVEASNRSVA